MTVIGQLPKAKKGSILISKHHGPGDSFLLGCTVDHWWRILFQPSSAIWHCPAEEWLKNPTIKWLALHAHCLPIRRTAPKEGHQLIKSVLEQGGRVSIFPESGLQVDSEVKRRPPVLLGKLIYEAKPTVIPVLIAGLPVWNGRKISQTKGLLEKIKLSCQRIFSSLGQKITVTIGQPIDLSDLYALDASADTYRQIAERLIANIQS
ncbi:MAG: lysophospholipid acyltransferase family protein [Candidatus Komeilibacteria bacterium]|nr:lysophospholipid acyltransferase family protein [Candidatus Komeilibacteria bacterium]